MRVLEQKPLIVFKVLPTDVAGMVVTQEDVPLVAGLSNPLTLRARPSMIFVRWPFRPNDLPPLSEGNCWLTAAPPTAIAFKRGLFDEMPGYDRDRESKREIGDRQQDI